MAREPRSGCAINAAVEVLGDAWSLIVLRDIVFGDRRHFREPLTQNEEGIASNILADRLRRLVAEGLLTRGRRSPRARVTYTLTEAGIQTAPVMVAPRLVGDEPPGDEPRADDPRAHPRRLARPRRRPHRRAARGPSRHAAP